MYTIAYHLSVALYVIYNSQYIKTVLGTIYIFIWSNLPKSAQPYLVNLIKKKKLKAAAILYKFS